MAWAFAVLAILLFAFAKPDYKIQGIEPEIGTSLSGEQDENRQQIIYGKVLKEKNMEPLPGASIVIKGTTVGTVSDRDGNFKLINTAPKVDPSTGGLTTELVISYVGYETEVTAIGPVVYKNDTGAPVVYHFQLKEGVVFIDSERFSKAKQPPHQANQPDAGSSGEEIFFIVEEMPEYSGGSYALEQFVTENQTRVARNKNLTGKAVIGFTVDPEGKVTDVKILESDSELNGNEAAKIVLSMSDWTPGRQRGVTVPVKYAVQIRF